MQARITSTIIVTRPEHASRRAAAFLQPRCRGEIDILVSPLLVIVPESVTLDLADCAGVVLTSENAVRSLDPGGIPDGLPAFCIGERTASAAGERGFLARQAESSAASLVALINRERPDGKLLYLRGRHAASDIVGMLRHAGWSAAETIVYDQVRADLNPAARLALARGPCVFPLFSARTARILAEEASFAPAPGHVICCLSRNVADAFDLDWQCRLATTPTSAGVLTLAVDAATRRPNGIQIR